jgi:general stress protein YciG
MGGTVEGGKRAAENIKKKFGSDFFIKLGKKSWQDPKRKMTGGFFADRELAKSAGSKGGKISRGKKKEI